MNNNTTVTAGVLAGAVSSIMWWAIGEFTTVSAPEFIIAATVVIFTAAIQYAMKAGDKE